MSETKPGNEDSNSCAESKNITAPKHPISVEGYSGSLEDLAKAVGRMRYDKVAEFVGYFAKHAQSEAEKDLADGKIKLPSKLFSASRFLYCVQDEYDSAWKICKPYMEEKK